MLLVSFIVMLIRSHVGYQKNMFLACWRYLFSMVGFNPCWGVEGHVLVVVHLSLP